MFSGLIFNTLEVLVEGTITRKGRIEYQFKMHGGITIVFVEAKRETGVASKRLDFMAQVIAECDGTAQAISSPLCLRID
jgi:hypothetical protein